MFKFERRSQARNLLLKRKFPVTHVNFQTCAAPQHSSITMKGFGKALARCVFCLNIGLILTLFKDPVRRHQQDWDVEK